MRLEDVVVRTKQVNPTRTPDCHFKYVDVLSINRESLRIASYEGYRGEDAPSRARKQIRAGDVIFATVRPNLKRVALVPETLDGEICSTAFCTIRANPDSAYFDFPYFVVSSDEFVKQVSEHQRGSSYPAVADTDVLNELIPLPALPIQRTIADALLSIDQKIETQVNRKQPLSSCSKRF